MNSLLLCFKGDLKQLITLVCTLDTINLDFLTMEILNPELLIGDRVIGTQRPVFFIAEVGQNHQGDMTIAKKLIDAAKECGADCVKFQKTDLNEKFTEEVLQRPYNTPNSWGKTYGEHKQYLEFSKDQFLELQEYAKMRDILFTSSAMDIKSLEFLLEMDVPFIKIGSGDANNMELIRKAAISGKPLIISTGMQSFDTVKKIEIFVKKMKTKNFAFLHCVSSYPTPLEDVNLAVITLFRSSFPDIVIGYSGHEMGIDISVAATILGARIVERHITLDHDQKGSDHKCSLLPEQFRSMIEKVKQMQIAMGIPNKIRTTSEMQCWRKLGKTIVAANKMKTGYKITEKDLKIKVTVRKGIDGIEYENLMGKVLNRDVNADEPLLENDINFN